MSIFSIFDILKYFPYHERHINREKTVGTTGDPR
jgi:hypothetical protein